MVTDVLQNRYVGDNVLARATELSGWLAERSDAIERDGRLPEEVLSALRDIGCLRMAVSRRYGGLDVGLPAVLAVLEQLARADGSVGWAVGQVALSQVMVGYLPRSSLDVLYGGGPDLLVAGAAAPKGRATSADTGWRVSGRWPLVTGAPYAEWVFLQCVVVENAAIQSGPQGLPEMRMVALPIGAVSVLETWDALGLRGTASHDVEVRQAICADGWSSELATAEPDDSAICRVPPPAQGGPLVAASVLGIARGALDAVTELARDGKRPAFSQRRLAESPLFQARLGDAELTLGVARAVLFSEVARADALGGRGALAALDRARLRAVAVKCVSLARGVVDEAYDLAGASSTSMRSPLQRRLRDVRTATQHFAAGRGFYAPLGALLAGETPDSAVDRPVAPK